MNPTSGRSAPVPAAIGTSSTAPDVCQPFAIGRRQPRGRGARIVERHFERRVGPLQQLRQPAGGAERRRRRTDGVDGLVAVAAPGQHRRVLRVQRRLDVAEHQRHQRARIRFAGNAAGQRQQDLPRVVLAAEELLIEPARRGIAVAQAEPGQQERRQIEQRARFDDRGQRPIALADQRDQQQDGGERRQQRQRLARHRVVQALPHHGARAERPAHGHGVGEAHRREQDQQLQHDRHRPGPRERHAGQVGDQRNGHQDGVGGRRRRPGEHRHLDAPPLLRVGVVLVAVHRVADQRQVDEDAHREPEREDRGAHRQPGDHGLDGIDAEQVGGDAHARSRAAAPAGPTTRAGSIAGDPAARRGSGSRGRRCRSSAA